MVGVEDGKLANQSLAETVAKVLADRRGNTHMFGERGPFLEKNLWIFSELPIQFFFHFSENDCVGASSLSASKCLFSRKTFFH